MLELIAIALIGSAIAGFWDLKTTEVPDEIPALMIASGLFVWFLRAIYLNQYYGLFMSLAAGTVLLVIGLALYRKGQWGGADAWMLAAIGYVLPVYGASLFILDYVFNFFIVSVAYMIIYAIALGALNPKIFSYALGEAKSKGTYAFSAAAAGIIAMAAAAYFLGLPLSALALPSLMIIALAAFYIYAKAIEKHAFRKKISSSKLKPGDVLEKMIWRGITEEEIAQIRKKHRYVVIKEGVRFVPVFAVTLAVTLAFGNLLLIAY